MNTIQVHNGGFVTLVASCASDLDVVNAARVSFNVTHDELQPGDDKLIDYLMRNKHGSPFEHTFFKFRIRLPIFVAREWIRHRIGNSFNEVSGRYTTIDNGFYMPSPRHVRRRVGKPGNYTYERFDDESAEYFASMIQLSSEESFHTYERLMNDGVAPELARIVLPLNAYTEWIWSVNARSLMAFLNLRAEKHAQQEIQDYAYAVEQIFAQVMPQTYRAWNDCGRVSP